MIMLHVDSIYFYIIIICEDVWWIWRYLMNLKIVGDILVSIWLYKLYLMKFAGGGLETSKWFWLRMFTTTTLTSEPTSELHGVLVCLGDFLQNLEPGSSTSESAKTETSNILRTPEDLRGPTWSPVRSPKVDSNFLAGGSRWTKKPNGEWHQVCSINPFNTVQ